MSGVVPLKPFREALEARTGVSEWSEEDDRAMPVSRMWNMDDFRKMFTREDRETIPFNMADQIACLMGVPQIWWNELSDIYYAVEFDGPKPSHKERVVPKGYKRCEADGCSNTFVPKRRDARFCCHNCLCVQWHRDKHGSRTLKNKRTDKCPRGHDRSPENVRYEKNKEGKLRIRCNACKRENLREWKRKKREKETQAA